MKDTFNQQVMGISPEQTRASLIREATPTQQTMVEQEQPVPTLKPSLGLGQAVDNQAHKKKLAQEHQRVQRYQIKITETHTRFHINGQLVSSHVERQVQPINKAKKLTNDFNQEAAQAHDMKQIGFSY